MKKLIRCVLWVVAIPYFILWASVALVGCLLFLAYRFFSFLYSKLDANPLVDYFFRDLNKLFDDNEKTR